MKPITEQGGPRPLQHNWRPSWNVGLAPALASPVFATFSDLLTGASRPPSDAMAVARELCKLASEYYNYEHELEGLVQELLRRYLGSPVLRFGPRPAGQIMTDGLILANPGESDQLSWLLCALLEVKLGFSSPGDSNFQGATYYGVFWEVRRQSSFFKGTCCPALLLEVVGPHLRVSALYWLDDVVVHPLTPLMNLLWLHDDEEHMISLARALAAIKSTLQALCTFYLQPPAPLPAAPAPLGLGAAVSRAPSLVEAMPYQLAGYQLVKRLPVGQLIYTAVSPSSGRPVVVRFARRYSEEAHRAWAAIGLAPQLHRFLVLPGGWVMVEMELLGVQDGWAELACQTGLDVTAAAAAAEAALLQAHQARGCAGQGYAHGDMRDTNIMVRRKAAGGSSEASAYEVKFVDFEFAGADGEVLYPPYLSEAVNWPAGVELGMPVCQHHDTALLATTVAQLQASSGTSIKPMGAANRRY
ncbi:hypothetical protein TSOC_013011 [Tetrabaena socialis]|uniref:Protein kinase domain-containing protein n=1 Tax=Tetrabaena socialis TaxID=47790 RepID=A0A2J7ZLH7_9CHLO|nr:hypothetical protein TSOC_013011 [Tetrabaena socialis]|eukprot:PNH01116.1 hypothetical protein TSOC_013011 [Tetrabaena socialis]